MTSRSPVFLVRFASARALAACVAFFAAPVFTAGAAGAADTPPASSAPSLSTPSGDVKAEARERFDTGLHLFEKGENAGALAEFKRAYQLIPNPVVLYNMGLVYAAMNRPVDAVDSLNQFIGDPGTAGAEQRTHAEQVRVEQTKRIAQLVILTDHPATIEVDGVEVGRTPLAKPIRVASGSHVVAVEAPGFLGSRREVTLAGQITETISMGMEPTDTRMAQLVVTAAVPGAEVVVNGKRVGATPLPASIAVAPGKVTVELQRAGYLTASQAISLDEGARGELTFTLREDPGAPPSLKGRLVVTASEPGAEMSVDGGARQPVAGAVTMPVGPHQVRLEKGGFEVAERNVEIINGQDASLLVTLVPTTDTEATRDAARSTVRNAGWALVIAGAALLAGGVVYGVVSQHDTTSSQNNLNDLLATDMQQSLPGGAKNLCYQDPTDPGAFVARGCAANVSSAQDSVNKAKLERDIGYGVAAVGLVAAGVGVAVVATHGKAETSVAGVSTANAWADGHGAGGLLIGGRF
ncbi:MAG TPA: PEGA domain-containing protein [Polyangia bacterium]|nr:PEGA domain-containing protein [Polyangia bacterium]